MDRGEGPISRRPPRFFGDFDSTVLPMGLGSGYLNWKSTGSASTLGALNQKPAPGKGQLQHMYAALASGSRSITITPYVAGVAGTAKVETLTTTWKLLTWNDCEFFKGELLAVHYSGGTVGVDRVLVFSTWALA